MTTDEFEFFGPHGPALLVFALPLVCYGLVFGCNPAGCLKVWPFSVPGFGHMPIFEMEGLLMYFSWFALILVLHLVLPARNGQGVTLPTGSRLTYRLNAFAVFCVVYPSIFCLSFFTNFLDLSWVHDHYLSLLTGSIVFSTALAVYLYVSSFTKGALLSEHGNSGYPAYDFWMGRELNPRIGSWDLKEFCELYPGMIGWAVVNLAMAHKQYKDLGYVTNSMVLVNVFQLYYVLDALWCEPSILTTMDITTDGFGFMLAFGDLSWVTFVFPTAARFLADFPQDLSMWYVGVILATKLVGYYIFRSANNQKDTFRRDPSHPSVKHLKTLKTERGTQLIASSWWGASRHINYLGDWVMGVSWCMPCGLQGLLAVIPYFYCVYFATLLIHRQQRDEAGCRRKYGKDWDKYCALVPYRIVPYVY